MAQRNIDFGAFPDDPDADAIRSAFEKVQLNFTEVFAGLGDQAVVSVNKTGGAGISVNQPTGNVVITNDLACVQFESSTLGIGTSPGTGPGTVVISSSAQTLYIDLPNSVANISDVVVSNSIQGNAIIGNVSGDFGYILANATSGNGNITANNISLTAALSAANVSGNGAGLSALFGPNITGQAPNALVAGTVYTGSQPNIVTVGTLTGLDVQSTVTAVAFTANTGLFTGDAGGLSNIIGANVTGAVTYATTANAVAGGNVVGEVGFAAVANSVAGSNVTGAVTYATTANAVAGANVSGEVTNAATANAVAGANVSGEVTFAATANIVAGANVSGIVASATLATTATTANAVAGANVTGAVAFATTANAVAGGNVSGEVTNAATANIVAGANVTGAVAFATTANAVAGANVSGQVAFAGTANAVAGANVSGTVANATHSSTANTVNDAAQPNITSTGTLTSVGVTGNVDSGNLRTTGKVDATGNVDGGNVNATGGVFTYVSGDGANLTNISVSTGSYIENGTSEARVDASGPFRVTVGGTANVLQVKNTGTNVEVTGSLSVSGGIDNNINFNSTSNLGPESNVTITGGAADAFLKTDGAGSLTWSTAVSGAAGSDTQIIFNDGGSLYGANTGFTFDKTSGNVAIPGSLSATLLGGTLTTVAQPNITSVGTLTALILGGALNTNNDVITTVGNIIIAGGSGTFKGDGGGLTNIPGANVSLVPTATLATTATTANAVAGANVSGEVPFAQVANSVAGANVSGEVTYAATANAVAGANVSGVVPAATTATTATTAGTVTSAAQSNITSVGTLTALSVTGNASAGNVLGTGGVFSYVSGDGANLTNIPASQVDGTVAFAASADAVAGANVSGTVALATTSGTVSTPAQANITSLGTLSALGVNGIITAQSVTANTGLFTGDGGALSNIAGGNVGLVANATYATSAGSSALALDITGASQPNITSVGTLTSLIVSGNITNQTHIIKDVSTTTAAGTTQGGATALSGADIFTITTNITNNGVRLMTATPGLCIYIKNLSGSNLLKVYPATSDAIDENATDTALVIGPKGHIQFVAHSASQWYSVGATYA